MALYGLTRQQVNIMKKSITIITTIIIMLTIAFGFYRLEKKNQELQQQINQLYEYNEKLDYHISGLLEKNK